MTDMCISQKRRDTWTNITYAASEKVLAYWQWKSNSTFIYRGGRWNGDLSVFFFFFFNIKIITVVFEHNNRWKLYLCIIWIFRPEPKAEKWKRSLIMTTSILEIHPVIDFYKPKYAWVQNNQLTRKKIKEQQKTGNSWIETTNRLSRPWSTRQQIPVFLHSTHFTKEGQYRKYQQGS